jgi:hypothetical protein
MRHALRPSDPSPAVINRADLDPDHSRHRQSTSLAIQPCAASTDGDPPSSPGSNYDRDGDGGKGEVSCLVAGLYKRCSVFHPLGDYVRVGVWGSSEHG